jgi:hypothetical protein
MEKTVGTAGQLPVISIEGVDVDCLEQWYKEYMGPGWPFGRSRLFDNPIC